MPQKQPRKAAAPKATGAGRGKRAAAKTEPEADAVVDAAVGDDVDCEIVEGAPKLELENGSVLYISNVMATVHLGCPLDLRVVAHYIKNCEFNMGSRKSTCMMRIRNPPVTAEIFNSGKVRIM
jgi:hypothetical protein